MEDTAPVINQTSLNTGFRVKLPAYFYDLAHPVRWTDPFASQDGEEERQILSLRELRDKSRRSKVYNAWLNRHGIKSRPIVFQRIRIVNDKYYESTPSDWWPKYHAAIFTVFRNPVTFYHGRKWTQFYILCPEDCELILRYEAKEKGTTLPKRQWPREKFISKHKALKICFVVPTECCRHLRNETVGGKLEYESQL